ncbi:MAG: Acetyl-coenzyme A synthetase [Verrucomicrobiae bacterium]|nr:Acetyl-coenzyme A synthetase [Verrucomicrobiae bacterium]
MDDWARRQPEGQALWCIDESGRKERKFTFAELATETRRAANYFQQCGIKRGDCVLVILPRIPEWWISLLGLIRLGAVPIPGATMLTVKDVRYRIEAAGIVAVITDGEGTTKLDGFHGIRILVRPAGAEWTKCASDFAGEPTRADDPGIIYFTSATTGQPKMVLHTQASYGLGHRVTGEVWLGLKPGEVHWCITDTGWAKAAWSCFYGPWLAGACVFAVDGRGKFDAGLALQILARYPIESWCAPPTALRLIVRENLSAYRFPHLRHCTSAGEPLNPEVIAAWQKATGLTIYEGYGQTETVALIVNRRSDEVRAGSMGKPTPGFAVALLDADLNEVPIGTEGEIAVRCKPTRPLGLFREYWRNPDENERRFRGDWYLTGDVATRDADGYFWFVGRSDDVIKSAAYRIGPFEVESALLEHPAVLESGVVGVPDAIRGQIVKAYVVLRRGYSASEALKQELQEHCKQVTAPYKYPREIEFVTELPKTISGKIRRVELREKA